MQLIEAVPNISEGKDPALLQELAHVLEQTRQVNLLGLDNNPAANRTVFTLTGPADNVCQALFQFISRTTQKLDMRKQKGVHPRLGAVDVCPLIPLQNISLQETAQLARQLAKRVGAELQIPVYLYEAAATRPACQNLADIRRGEYESLPAKLQTLQPDFGPCTWTEQVQKTGACIIGARNFLIAFNINLDTCDVAPAQKIASVLRQSNGGLQGVKAIGWYVDNWGRAQVSCNITDFKVAPLPLVFQTCQKEAARLGVRATGCELVGLVPLQAMLDAGRFYTPQENSPRQLIQTAVEQLNLAELKPFSPSENILDIKAGLSKLNP